MKNWKPREKLGGSCARDAIFHPDKHPDWSLSLLISASSSPCREISSLSLSHSLSRVFAKALQREVAKVAMQNERKKKGGVKGKKRRYSNQLASDDYLSRGTARRFFMRCSVYALIQLDERKKKSCKQRFNVGSRWLYPSPPPFFTLLFVFCPFPTPLTHAVQRSRESVWHASS